MSNTSNNDEGALAAFGATQHTTHADDPSGHPQTSHISPSCSSSPNSASSSTAVPQGRVTPQRIPARPGHPASSSRFARTHHDGSTPGRRTRSYLRKTSSKAAKLSLAGVALSLVATSIATVSPAYAVDLTPQGIDVASHQHPFGARVNWLKVRLGGYSFAIIKATEGTGYINPFFEQNRDEAHLAGMIVGSYHYARPDQDPIKQALYYADTIKCQKRPLEMPPVLDLEETGGLHPILLQGWTAAFLTTLNLRCATNTMVYTYPYFWRTAMRNTPLFSFAPLWIADYNGGTEPTQPLPGGWRHWNIWQYSSTGRVPGVNTAVDLNKFNGGYVSLAAFSLRQETVPTVPTISVKGKWKVDPAYVKKALRQAKAGLPAAPLYKAPTGVDPIELYQTTVQRGPVAPRS